MGSRWQLRVPRAEDEREHNPVRGVIHNIHRIKPPLPRTPSPFYRHLFLRGRGRATITEVHLNLPPGLTPQPGSPQPALLASPTLTVDTIPRFRPNQSSSKGGPNLPLLTSIEMTPDASAVVTFHRIHWKGSPESARRASLQVRSRRAVVYSGLCPTRAIAPQWDASRRGASGCTRRDGSPLPPTAGGAGRDGSRWSY